MEKIITMMNTFTFLHLILFCFIVFNSKDENRFRINYSTSFTQDSLPKINNRVLDVKLRPTNTVVVNKNIDTQLQQSKQNVERFLKKNKFDLKNKNLFYKLSYINADRYDFDICNTKLNLKPKSYQKFFQNWDFQDFATAYIYESTGKIVASSTHYTLIKNPNILSDHEFNLHLVQLGLKKEYKAFVEVPCKNATIYIGYNNKCLDIYKVVGNNLILITQ